MNKVILLTLISLLLFSSVFATDPQDNALYKRDYLPLGYRQKDIGNYIKYATIPAYNRTLVGFSNGLIMSNATNNYLIWTENSETFNWIFSSNTLTLKSSTGGNLLDVDQLDLKADNVKLGSGILDSLGRTLVYIQNKTGSALAEGDAVVWDNTAVSVVGSAALAAKHTVAANLAAEKGFHTVVLTWTGTPDAGDSVYVYGTTYENGAADTACVLLAATDGGSVMAKKKTGQTFLHFSKIDSVKCNADAVAGGASALVVSAYGVTTVKACDGGNPDIAGVSICAIVDNAYGYICTHGICKATVDCATAAASPGVLLEGAANGDLVTDAAATTGQNIGWALEYCNQDNALILVYIDRY
jgi:hypothetical protein